MSAIVKFPGRYKPRRPGQSPTERAATTAHEVSHATITVPARDALAERRAAAEVMAPVREDQRKRCERLEWFEAFGRRLREARLALGLTEVEAAAACFITLRTYRKREAGSFFPGGLGGLISFANRYDVDAGWLICGAHPKRPKLAIVPTSA